MKKSIEQKKTFKDTIIPSNNKKVKISVVVISYNQENYIAECLNGILKQKGDFIIELVVGDDCSTDRTLEIIKNFAEQYDNNDIQLKILATEKNIGMTKNLQRCLYACTGDYVAICEGDDYWIDPLKLQKQMSFLTAHPDCSVCFHRIYIYYQNTDKFGVFEPKLKLVGDIFTTKDLVLEYFIGNLSCCMYNAKYLKQIREDLFNLFIGDWMFNIYYSQFGNIGYINDLMSVYRKHNSGSWAGKSTNETNKRLYSYINSYNKYLNFEYDKEFSIYQQNLRLSCPEAFANDILDLAIIDDIAPHPFSAFRVQEFDIYLREFENIKIYCSGNGIHFWGEKRLDKLIVDFKRKNPQFADKLEEFKAYTLTHAKLIYFVFLGNAFEHIDMVEDFELPFVFTLYPGGLFNLNNHKSDQALKRVTKSPCFCKVIVTQKITYDYLIEKKFCTPDQIEFIFGVVTPLEQIEKEYIGKKHFGVDKDILDICFVAHKYTETGIDKGYDVFVAVANVLSQKYQNVRFHVVGGFDENVLDVSDLQGRIKFYGNQEMEWFDEFYRDKDIILSPNIPFKIFEGSFDGFPTGSCTDAGLRETAIFCTDELKLNDGFFIDGEEIVIIPHDIKTIIEIIEFYYREPEKLKNIAKNGRKKIKELYGYESQILPRINLLKEQIQLFEHNKEEIRKKFNSIRYFPNLIRRFTMLISRVLRKLISLIPVPLKNRLKSILPSFFIKIYNRFFI